MRSLLLAIAALTVIVVAMGRACADQPARELPPAATAAVDFHVDILPILARRCASCHAHGKQEGGLSLETGAGLMHGGDSGAVVVPGKSAESLLVQLTAGLDESRIMPANGRPLTPRETGALRRWIDDGAVWPADVVVNAAALGETIKPRRVAPPAAPDGIEHPIDRFVAAYFVEQGRSLAEPVDDATYCRRVWLDLAGQTPTADDIERFAADGDPGKRGTLVRRLLDDRTAYALHWMAFWNDLLRNSYRGTGFIDDGRTQITEWLFAALYDNRPYDEFVRELIAPSPASRGFIKGIAWRGVVNASQRTEMQAAQTVSQVFLGTNLKCASCHDSFVNQWTLAEAYALASVFAEKPLEIHHCDQPIGEQAAPGFLFPSLGQIDAAAPRDERLRQLADALTAEDNGRLARTIVNRLWARFFGRGIVPDLDDMDQEAFSRPLLDWLAADLQDHGYDLQRTMELICTSRAYQSPAVGAPPPEQSVDAPFRGPVVRRMTAEQFVDALSQLTGEWQPQQPSMINVDGRGQGGQLAAVLRALDARGVDVPRSLVYRTGQVAQALELDGGQAVRVAHDPRLKPCEQMTIAAWIRPTRLSADWQHLIRKEDGVDRWLLAVGESDQRMGVWMGAGIGGAYQEFGADVGRETLLDGAWHHVAAVYDGQAMRIFVDGQLAGEHAASGPLAASGEAPAYIGGYFTGKEVKDHFAGGLDDLRIYDRGLSAEQVRQLVERGAADGAAPVAHWTFDGKTDESIAGLASEPIGGVVPEALRRAVMAESDPLLVALGQSASREQVITRRESLATTLEALELTNGATLDAILRRGAEHWLAQSRDPAQLVTAVYRTGLGRDPTPEEMAAAAELLGPDSSAAAVQDLLWSIVMLPEFQLID